MGIKVTRPNVVLEMPSDEWELLRDYLVQLDYPDFHQKMNREAAAKLQEIVASLKVGE